MGLVLHERCHHHKNHCLDKFLFTRYSLCVHSILALTGFFLSFIEWHSSLDGIWQFRTASSLEPDTGFTEAWYQSRLWNTGPTQDMPVPASFNDITTDVELRDFTGWAWYDREFFLPKSWNVDNEIVKVRVGSTNYEAIVWINGQARKTIDISSWMKYPRFSGYRFPITLDFL